MATKPPVPKKEPWHPADWGIAEVSAVQALFRGEANEQQQRLALDWIIYSAGMAHDQSFVPGQPDVSDFIEGRRSVANQILKLRLIDLANLKDAK
jgi:hypothetical protein